MLFGVEVFDNGLVDTLGEFGNAAVASLAITLHERYNVANFGFDAGAIAIFFDGATVVNGSGALELAEGFAESFIAATENPVGDFTLAHIVEVIHREIVAEHHGFDDIGQELSIGTVIIAMINSKVAKHTLGVFFGDVKIAEAKFFKVIFVMQNGDIFGKAFDLVNIPSIVDEITVGEGIF